MNKLKNVLTIIGYFLLGITICLAGSILPNPAFVICIFVMFFWGLNFTKFVVEPLEELFKKQ